MSDQTTFAAIRSTLKSKAGAPPRRLLETGAGDFSLELQSEAGGAAKNIGQIKIFAADKSGTYFGKITETGQFRPFGKTQTPKGFLDAINGALGQKLTAYDPDAKPAKAAKEPKAPAADKPAKAAKAAPSATKALASAKAATAPKA